VQKTTSQTTAGKAAKGATPKEEEEPEASVCNINLKIINKGVGDPLACLLTITLHWYSE
jgi:hypothetical protein